MSFLPSNLLYTLQSLCNLSFSIVSIGSITYSFSFKYIGYINGIFLSALFSILFYYSSNIIISKIQEVQKDNNVPTACCDPHGIVTIEEIIRYYYGRIAYLCIALIIVIASLSTLVENLRIFENLLLPFIIYLSSSDSIAATPFFITAVLLYSIVIPLCCINKFRHITGFAFIGLICVLSVAVVVIIRVVPLLNQSKPVLATISTNTVFCYAWNAHLLLPFIFSDLPKVQRNSTTMSLISGFSSIFAFIVLTTIGLFGAILFGHDTKFILLDNFSPSDVVIIFVRLFNALHHLFSIPILFFPIRRIMIYSFYDNDDTLGARIVLSFLILSVVLGLSILIPHAVFIGSFAFVVIQFLIPGILLLSPLPWLRELPDEIKQRYSDIEKEQLVDSKPIVHTGKEPWLYWEEAEEKENYAKRLYLKDLMKKTPITNLIGSIGYFLMAAIVLAGGILSNVRAIL